MTTENKIKTSLVVMFAISVLLMVFATVGCGGGSMKPVSVTQSAVAITASQVFSTSMIGQTWTFVNGYGDHTFIAIEAAPFCVFGVCDGKSVTAHITKDNIRAWFDPGKAAELWFFLHLDSDGAWRSPGWEMIEDGVQKSGNFGLLAGWTGAPYTIIPASSTAAVVNTAYQGTVQDGLTVNLPTVVLSTWVSTWTTLAGTETITTPLTGTVTALKSKQCEGGISGACNFIVEDWAFCPGVGLCAINPTFGLNGPLDPKLALVRQ